MLTINAIVEESKVNPGKMLYVNVGGYLYGLSAVHSQSLDAVIYSTQPVRQDSKPSAQPVKDVLAIGVEPHVQAALDLVEAVKKAIA